MPRVNVPLTALVGSYPLLPLAANAADLAWLAANTSDKNSVSFDNAAQLCLLARNTSADTAYTMDVTSAPDLQNRVGDIDNYSIGAGDVAVFLLSRAGWRQSDGKLYIEAANTAIQFAAFKL